MSPLSRLAVLTLALVVLLSTIGGGYYAYAAFVDGEEFTVSGYVVGDDSTNDENNGNDNDGKKNKSLDADSIETAIAAAIVVSSNESRRRSKGGGASVVELPENLVSPHSPSHRRDG